jgi:hypothetical protein
MKKITKNKLENILEQHKKWRYSGGKEGKRAELQGANLSGADLKEANLQGAGLEGADLREANLQGADLEGASLSGTDLKEANLQEANLQGADLEGADLEGADLSGADLSGADLERADLEEANLQGASLEGAKLQRANGIKTVQFTHTQFSVLFIYTKKLSYLQIGCLSKSIPDWENKYIELAKKYNYTDLEIKEVQSFVNYCKQTYGKYKENEIY